MEHVDKPVIGVSNYQYN